VSASTWKWALEAPLAPAWRKRLELCFGVVLSGAAVVALSSTIRPDPAKLAALHDKPAIVSLPQPIVDATEPPSLSRAMATAVESGNVRAMRTAYRPGMPLDGTLRLAAQSGRKEAVLWLLAHGADVHEQEDTTNSPILAADPFPEVVALLRSRGAKEPTLVSAASAAAPNAIARTLAEHPERVKRSGALAATANAPWRTAAVKRSIMTRLLDAGADPNEAHGATSAFGDVVTGCDTHEDDCMAFVRLFLDHGARVTGEVLGDALSLDETRPSVLDALLERPIEKGVTATALARATSVNSDDLARVVKLGVDWAWDDGEEDAALPLLAAVRRGDRDYARALLDAGAPVDVHFKEATCALAEAIDGSASDDAPARIVELLVERGANVNRRFPDGRTPLFAAAEAGNVRVVNFLVAHGARVNERILDETALDVAEEHGNTPAARVLAAHGGLRVHPSMYSSTY
jgi:hypothetical protein